MEGVAVTLAELIGRRERIKRDLGAGRRHVLIDLRGPAPEIAHLPIGDLLCWCDGLGEAQVVRILQGAEVNWGRRVSLLSSRDQAALCFQIKARCPEVWEAWLEAHRERRGVAA